MSSAYREADCLKLNLASFRYPDCSEPTRAGYRLIKKPLHGAALKRMEFNCYLIITLCCTCSFWLLMRKVYTPGERLALI